ncbi:MAG: hypothetical protein HC893_03520 [Chloroflexaceae bacterium]|nr:hypothetical protein [Chloroflexaceae bacterium]
MPWEYSYAKLTSTVEDEEGTSSSPSFFLKKANALDGAEITAVLGRAAALKAAVDGVTEGRFARYSVNFRLTLTDPLVLAGEVEKKARFTFVAANGLYYPVIVPGVRESLLTANGKDINLLHASVLAFESMMINGPFGAGNGPCTDAGSSLTWIKGGVKQHSRSRVRRRRAG